MRRVESIQVPGETRRMLRERFTRLLPTYSVPTGNLPQALRPLVSDMEVLDLFLNLELSCGKDLSHARRLYDLAAQHQTTLLAALSPPQSGGTEISSDTTSMHATGASVSDTPADPDGSGPSTAEGISAAENGLDGAPVPPRVTTQLIAASPRLDGLSPPPSFDELVERGWIRISWDRYEVPQDICMAVLRNPQSAGTEPPRVWWRLQPLREWSHE